MSKPIKKTPESGKENKLGEKIPQKSRSKGKTTKQVMTKHILDKNDIITDEEFKNLNIDLDISKDTAHVPLEISNDDERPKDEDKDHSIVTPWDVIK